MAIVYLSQGSNLGNREKFIKESFASLAKLPETSILKKSGIYESQALTPEASKQAPPYLNTILKISTTQKPSELLLQLQKIEKNFGRSRTTKWANRTLDIDIISFDDQILSSSSLTLPHPQFHLRNFVLIPLLEIGVEAIAGIKLVDLPCATEAITKIRRSDEW